VELGERVQSLWSGYGEIRRATLSGAVNASVIVKLVVPPKSAALGPAETRSHLRKLRSYEVERAFYRAYAPRCGAGCRVPAALHESAEGDRTLLVLDTVTGSDAERMYARLGWQKVGEIPGYALFPHGGRCSTTVFYRELC
jgi:hypothetical protein